MMLGFVVRLGKEQEDIYKSNVQMGCIIIFEEICLSLDGGADSRRGHQRS